MPTLGQCSLCKHGLPMKDDYHVCKAFPDGIPDRFIAYSFESKEEIELDRKLFRIEMAPHDKVVEGRLGSMCLQVPNNNTIV